MPLRGKQKPRSASLKHPQPRDVVMISHATEDDQFTRWLALQLARNGYRVWCDLTKLLGGESFWHDIESLLRHRASKFIYVLSRSSNHGEGRGFWKELDLADAVARTNGIVDFIVPVAIDDLSSKDYNIFVHSRHTLRFNPYWSDGLKNLLKKLDKQKVPRRQRFNPGSVTTWWRKIFRSPSAGVVRKSETYFSSWFAIEHLPKMIYVHSLKTVTGDAAALDGVTWARPAVGSGQRIVSFAPIADFMEPLNIEKTASTTEDIVVDEILKGKATSASIDGGELRRLLAWLLRETWDWWARQQPVGIYSLANNAKCAFFLKPKDGDTLWAPLTSPNGSESERALTGYWTRPNKIEGGPRQKRYWHFGIQAQPRLSPKPLFRVLTHVIFTDDGKTPWVSKKRMHAARRSQCKSWYNDVWRDRLLAAMRGLAPKGTGMIVIPVSEEEHLDISIRPMTFNSSISFTVISKSAKPIESDKDRGDQEEPDKDEDNDDAEDSDGDDDDGDGQTERVK